MTLVTVMRQIELDAGHRVPHHESKCRSLHGHRYKIQVELVAPEVVPTQAGQSESGMVMDFGLIKTVLMEVIHDVYDHSLILWEQDELATDFRFIDMVEEYNLKVIPVPVVPTAEQLARHWGMEFYSEWRKRLKDHHLGIDIAMKRFTVWETPNAFATFE